MLNYSIIENKPSITMPNGEKQLDLLAQTFSGHAEVTPYSNILQVTKYYIARPDLISLVVYGTEEYADVLCKLNGISNPFEINEGMELILPEISTIREYCSNANNAKSAIITDDTLDILDKTTISLNARSGTLQGKRKNEKRSPNDATIEDVNYILNKSINLIIY